MSLVTQTKIVSLIFSCVGLIGRLFPFSRESDKKVNECEEGVT